RSLKETQVGGCLRMDHESDAADAGRDFIEYLKPFAGDRCLENPKPGKVSSGMRYICDEPATDGIADESEPGRYGAGFPLQDLRNKIRAGHDYIWCHSDQLFGKSPRLIRIATCPARVDPNIAAFSPT